MEWSRVTCEDGVNQEGWEAEVVDDMGLVAVPQVADVLVVRHVRLGHDDRPRLS